MQAQVIESSSGSLRAGRAGSAIALSVSQAGRTCIGGHKEIAVSRSPGPEFPTGTSLVVIGRNRPDRDGFGCRNAGRGAYPTPTAPSTRKQSGGARINNMGEPWTIDELAHAGHEHLDPAFVASFDDKQGHPDPAEDLAVLVRSGLGKESTVVDLGAGTGQFALLAARDFGKVIAVDVSPAMLEALRNRASELALDNLDCIQAGFLSYEHAGPPADAVYTRNALHQLPDF